MQTQSYEQLLEGRRLIWYLHFLINNEQYISQVEPEYFTVRNTNSLLSTIYSVVKDFYSTHRKVPTLLDIKEGTRLLLSKEEISDDILDMALNPKTTEGISSDFIKENFLTWLEYVKVHTALTRGLALIKTTQPGKDLVSEIQTIFKRLQKPAEEESVKDLFDMAAYNFVKAERFSTGYKFIDEALAGGLWRGSLISFLAGPKVGKSGWMINIAKNLSMSGKNVCFISLELTEEMVFKRFSNNILDISSEELEYIIETDEDKFREMIREFKENNPQMGKLAIKQLPTSRANPAVLENMLLRAQEELGIIWDVVIIDYFNLLSGKGENSYIRIKNIVEELRGMAMENGWAIISPTQANRDGAKSESLELSNISESINVAATVDVLFSLETSETLREQGKQRVRCLLSRVSGKQDYYQDYDVNWNTMRIKECPYQRSKGSEMEAKMMDQIDEITKNSELIGLPRNG